MTTRNLKPIYQLTTYVLSIGPKLKSPFCFLFTEQICCCVANSCLVLYHRGKSHSGTNAISTRHRCVKMHKFANAVKSMRTMSAIFLTQRDLQNRVFRNSYKVDNVANTGIEGFIQQQNSYLQCELIW